MIRRPAGVAAVIAAAVVGGVLLHDRWYNQTPPELQSAGPGTVRLTGPCCVGAPPVAQPVTLKDGSIVRLQFGATHGGNPRAAQVFVMPPSGAHITLVMNEGEQRMVETVTVRLLHVWTEPRPSNEAIDVRVTDGG